MQENIPHTERPFSHYCGVPNTLEKKLATFLRKQRGDQTFAAFSRKLGLPASTLFRLERCEQSITLGRLQQIMDRLKCDLWDIFGDGKK